MLRDHLVEAGGVVDRQHRRGPAWDRVGDSRCRREGVGLDQEPRATYIVGRGIADAVEHLPTLGIEELVAGNADGSGCRPATMLACPGQVSLKA